MSTISVQTITITALVLFALAMVGVGLYSWHKTQTVEGFLLGSRNVGAWVSAFAYGTSYFSAVIFVGYAGKHGWDIGIGSIWIGIGNALLGCFLAWKLLAKRTRNMTHTISAKTMPEFFQLRYDSKRMKITAAIIIFVFLVPYSAAVYKGLGNMFYSIFPKVDTSVWMLVIAILTSIYLLLGGYVAEAYADMIQGIIMIIGVIAMVFAVVSSKSVGGFASFWQNLSQIPDNGDGITGKQLTSIFGGSSFKFLATNILLTSFGTWGLPQMVSKYYAIKDEKSIKTATVVSTLFAFIIGAGAYFVGSISRLVLNNTLPDGGHDLVIPTVLTTALGDTLVSKILLAVILVLLLSASMSTLVSVVLSSASAISIDLIPEIKKNYSDKSQLVTTRLLCFIFIICSYIFATANISIIVNIMSFSWGVVSGCFIGAYVWGIYSKKITRAGAWCGIGGGFLTVLIPTVVISITKGFAAATSNAATMGVCAMAVSLIIVPVVSAFTKKYDEEHINKIFK